MATKRKNRKLIGEPRRLSFTVYSNPPSKSNSYKIGVIDGHRTVLKKDAVRLYEEAFFLQCPFKNARIMGWFRLEIQVFFASNRSDLDGCFKAVLDCLQQCNVIDNDRYCMEIHAYKRIDPKNPRVEITITELDI